MIYHAIVGVLYWVILVAAMIEILVDKMRDFFDNRERKLWIFKLK